MMKVSLAWQDAQVLLSVQLHFPRVVLWYAKKIMEKGIEFDSTLKFVQKLKRLQNMFSSGGHLRQLIKLFWFTFCLDKRKCSSALRGLLYLTKVHS